MVSREEKAIKLEKEMEKEEKKAKRKKIIIKLVGVFIILLLCIVALICYMHYIGTKGLQVREYKIVNNKLPESFHGFKIVQYSDLHYLSTVNKSDLKKIVSTINKLKPDIVVFTGDLIDKNTIITSNDINDLIELFNKIKVTTGLYAIRGNHDYDNNYFDLVFNQTSFKILNNSNDLIYYHGNMPILIAGIGSSIKENIDIDNIFSDYDTENMFTITLLHEPDSIDNILNTEHVDLALAGHSHNGQIRLPFIGALKTVNGAKKYKNEYYHIGNTDLYISGGIGTSDMKLRFFDRPSISIYRLVEK